MSCITAGLNLRMFLIIKTGLLRYVTFAIRAYNVLIEILSTDYLEPVAIDELIGIQKGTPSAIRLRTERRSCKVSDFFKCWSFSQKTLAEFDHVNPIERAPSRIKFFRTLEPEIEIETVSIECNSFFRFHNKKAARKRPIPRKKAGRCFYNAKVVYFLHSCKMTNQQNDKKFRE